MENNNKVELKVNVINQLKLLRRSTFKDVLCFLDEDIQNAQRAKATEVRITTEYSSNTIIIENNGQLLENPQCLFSIAESGWDEEVKNTENPFGMGFFSNITVSNNIEIYSGDKHIVFDVDKMIKTNDTEILVEKSEEYYEGFKLILNNIDFGTIYTWSISERVQTLGKYVQELDIYYNNKLQEKKDLLQGDDSPFQKIIDTEDIKGYISLYDYIYGNKLDIFYKGRLVTTLPNMPYVKGDLHISDKTLNLTSPDRKDIIKDDKYTNFIKNIHMYVEEICNSSLLNEDKEVKDCSNAICYYVNKDVIKHSIKFITLKDTELQYIEDIARVTRKNKNIDGFKGLHLYLESERKTQSESNFKEIIIEEEVVLQPEDAKGIISHNSISTYREGYTETPEIKEKDTKEVISTEIITGDEPVFWMKFNEARDFEYKLNVIKHYNLKIIISRNDVESKLLEYMKDTDNVHHISELNEEIKLTGYLTNTELNTKEERALMIFNVLSTILGFDHNIFVIGDLMVTKNITVKALNSNSEIVETDVTMLRDDKAKKVYIDRSIIDLSELDDKCINDTTINLKDYKFILCNLYSIVKESFLLINKNQDETMEQILISLGKGIL